MMKSTGSRKLSQCQISPVVISTEEERRGKKKNARGDKSLIFVAFLQ
jgi:hypothetical protein